MPAATAAPAPIWAIASLAVLPFPVAAAVYAYGTADVAGSALTVILTWSAVVLSFVGGVRWGLESGRAHPRWTRLAASLVSPVFAWGLVLARGQADSAWLLGGFLVAFILQWLFDHTAPDVPARYPRLLTTLTLVASLSLAVALEQALQM